MTLQQWCNSTRSDGEYTWTAFEKIVQNATKDKLFKYDIFKSQYDSAPSKFQPYVLDFNKYSITLNTKTAEPNNPQLQQQPQDSMSDIKNTAMSAAPSMLDKKI